MTVKTCIVIGHFELGASEGRVFESAPFGYQCEYATAHHFIETVRKMHRANGSDLTITNVVIG